MTPARSERRVTALHSLLQWRRREAAARDLQCRSIQVSDRYRGLNTTYHRGVAQVLMLLW